MKPLKVSEVNSYIKKLFSRDMILTKIDIEGEVSNFKHHYSGHMYFTLKDNNSKIRCVMFRDDNLNCDIDLTDGMSIIASGNISIYEREGSYQFYVRDVEEHGIGDLYKKFELLKIKLEKEGLFSRSKKQLPLMPKNIGVVTSSTGAAIKDIINVIKRRNPTTNIYIYSVTVQGTNAAREIMEGLKYLDKLEYIDLIITGRGGGSIEELFAFNDENLARCIYSLNTPIITAVGHETDFTIADFVADKRAPTPSAAAEIAVPNAKNLFVALEDKHNMLNNIVSKYLTIEKNNLVNLSRYIDYSNPMTDILNRKQDLDYLLKELNDSLKKRIALESSRLESFKGSLEFYDKFISLDSGLGVIYDENNTIIKSIAGLKLKDKLSILLNDGTVEVMVTNINKRSLQNDK